MVLILLFKNVSSQYTNMMVSLSFEYIYTSSSVLLADGAADGSELRFRLYVKPIFPNSPSSGYSGGQCFSQSLGAHPNYPGHWLADNCNDSYHHGHPGDVLNPKNNGFNPVIYTATFDQSTGFPTELELYLEAWESDGCGPSCEYNTSCLLNDDDLYEAEVIGNFNFRSWGPPCSWNGGDYNNSNSNFYTSTNNYGVSVKTYYEYNESNNLTHYWLGEKNNNWFSECNWSTKHVPDNNDDVIIPFPLPSTSGVLPRIYANSSANGQAAGQAYCNTLEVENGAKVTIENGAKLNVTQ